MNVTLSMYLIVCPLVFLAAVVDAIGGGGGLISLPALAFSTLGGWVGSRLAVRRGAKFIRYVMLGVMGLIIVKLAYEWFA